MRVLRPLMAELLGPFSRDDPSEVAVLRLPAWSAERPDECTAADDENGREYGAPADALAAPNHQRCEEQCP